MTNSIACLNWILLILNTSFVFLCNLSLGMNPGLIEKLPSYFPGVGIVMPILLLFDVVLRLIFFKKPKVHFTISIALYMYMSVISIIYCVIDNSIADLRNAPVIIISISLLTSGLFCAIYLEKQATRRKFNNKRPT